MKKLILATAVAAMTVTAAHAEGPTLYGKVVLTLDATQNTYEGESSTNTRVNSDYSRIGIKGSQSLDKTSGTDLIYQLEYGVYVNSNDAQFRSRDTYLGLTNKQYGTGMIGRLTSIDDYINYTNQGVGQFDNSFGGASWDGNRANSSFVYMSPSIEGVQVLAMYSPKQKDLMDNMWVDSEYNLANGSGFGIGAKYEPAGQPFRTGVTYISSGDFNTMRLSGAFDLNQQMTLAAMYQLSKSGDLPKENVISVSGQLKTGTPWTAYAQADMIKNVHFIDGGDNKQFILGGRYAYNPNTTAHVYAGYHDYDDTDYWTMPAGHGFGIGAGLEYRF